MTIETTIQKTVSREIELPYYCKSSNYFIKVVSETQCVAVNENVIAKWMPSSLKIDIATGTPITAEEFEDALLKTQLELSVLITQKQMEAV